MIDSVVKDTSASATKMTKEQAASVFWATTDYGNVTKHEIDCLDKMYKDIRMTSSCNSYMKGLLKHLKEGGGAWQFKRLIIRRNEKLYYTNSSGNQIHFGIRGTLSQGYTKLCDTLERPKTGAKRCVAAGMYTLRLRSPHSSLETDGILPTSKPYTRIQIPDRQTERVGIQLHWGKNVSWSDGCTLVGKYDDKGKWLGNKSEEIYKTLLKKLTGTDKAYKPADAAEWSLVPRVKVVLHIIGEPT